VIQRSALFLAGFLLLVGCAGQQKIGGDPDIQVIDSTELPQPDRGDALTQARPYIVGPFDKLMIDVFGVQELSQRKVQVDASGRISFPLVGVITVAGNSPGEIEQILQKKLEEAHVRNPQVTINLEETVSQVVTVEGQVKKPGLFPVVGRMTLLRSVALAGGTDEFAKLDSIVVFRTVKGEQYAALYSLRQIRVGAYKDPEIFANDVVIVGESRARRVFKDFLQVLPALSTPIIVAVDRLR
jgi:polysaccharide biosynthesis/export protein